MVSVNILVIVLHSITLASNKVFHNYMLQKVIVLRVEIQDLLLMANILEIVRLSLKFVKIIKHF